MISPIELLNTWLTEEQTAGAPNPRQAVLATCAKDAIPHARVVAIREMDERGFLFFTQKNTRKARELLENPVATITFWFELVQREVIIEGKVIALSDKENEQYWESNPRENQIRFTTYAPTSSQPITDKAILESKKNQIQQGFQGKIIPVSPFYCGFRVIPERFMFYAVRSDELSDVFEFRQEDGIWVKQWLSP